MEKTQIKTNHIKTFNYTCPNVTKDAPADNQPPMKPIALSFALTKEQEPGFLAMLEQAVVDLKDSIAKG